MRRRRGGEVIKMWRLGERGEATGLVREERRRRELEEGLSVRYEK